MNKDSKKILVVGILITLIIGFLIIWILIEDHKPANKNEYKNSHTGNTEQINYQNNLFYTEIEQNNLNYCNPIQKEFCYLN